MTQQSTKLFTSLTASSGNPLNEQIYQKLRWALIIGVFAPGDTLSIRKLAAEFETSAMPVREALKRLASERALVCEMNKSFSIRKEQPKRVADLFFVRSSLEGAATELAVPNLTARQIERLEELATSMDENRTTETSRQYLIDNYAFHFTIYNGADNPELIAVIEGLWTQTGPFLNLGINIHDAGHDIENNHQEIASAIKSRDAITAGRLIEDDINWGTNLFSNLDD